MSDSSTTCSEVDIHINELDRSLFSHLLSMKQEKERKRLVVPFVPAMGDMANDDLSDACIVIDSDELFVQEKRVYGRVWVHVHVQVGSNRLFETYQVSVSTIHGELVCISEEIDGIRMYVSAKQMLSCFCIDAARRQLKKMREAACERM